MSDKDGTTNARLASGVPKDIRQVDAMLAELFPADIEPEAREYEVEDDDLALAVLAIVRRYIREGRPLRKESEMLRPMVENFEEGYPRDSGPSLGHIAKYACRYVAGLVAVHPNPPAPHIYQP